MLHTKPHRVFIDGKPHTCKQSSASSTAIMQSTLSHVWDKWILQNHTVHWSSKTSKDGFRFHNRLKNASNLIALLEVVQLWCRTASWDMRLPHHNIPYWIIRPFLHLGASTTLTFVSIRMPMHFVTNSSNYFFEWRNRCVEIIIWHRALISIVTSIIFGKLHLINCVI